VSPEECDSSHCHHQTKLSVVVKLVILLHPPTATHSHPQPPQPPTATHSHPQAPHPLTATTTTTTTTATTTTTHHIIRPLLNFVEVQMESTPFEQALIEEGVWPKAALMAIPMQLPMSDPNVLAHIPLPTHLIRPSIIPSLDSSLAI
jgi:hypothetical protein